MAAAVIGAAVILLGRHHFDPRDAQEVRSGGSTS
jgi:hypothetical protein